MKESLHYLLMSDHLMVQKALLNRIKDTGLTSGQPKILDYLMHHDGAIQKEIAVFCHIEPASLTVILNGMENKGYKMPNELSGGEQQRIVIARAILNKPEIILADEPTGNLDVETGRNIVKLLQEICTQGTAIIMTTHNLNLLSEFPGKVYCCGQHQLREASEY